MILPPAIEIVNGTHIVPLYFPAEFTPSQIDRLGWTAIITVTWPTIIGVLALIAGTRDWYQYSFTPLCITWFLSIAAVAVGIFTRFGIYDHFLHFLAIAHVQWEWLIITYLLGYSFQQGYFNATVVGLILLLTDLGFPGIRLTFFAATVGGGFGDVFIPVLLWNGGRRLFALAAVGHFLNVLVAFYGFVDYIPIGPYLALQLLFGGFHVLATVVGIFELQKPAIHLEETAATSTDGAPSGSIIPPVDHQTLVKLIVISAAISLVGSLPLNFAPKYPFFF